MVKKLNKQREINKLKLRNYTMKPLKLLVTYISHFLAIWALRIYLLLSNFQYIK